MYINRGVICRWVDGWVDIRRISGQMQTGGWVDSWVGGWKDRSISFSFIVFLSSPGVVKENG